VIIAQKETSSRPQGNFPTYSKRIEGIKEIDAQEVKAIEPMQAIHGTGFPGRHHRLLRGAHQLVKGRRKGGLIITGFDVKKSRSEKTGSRFPQHIEELKANSHHAGLCRSSRPAGMESPHQIVPSAANSITYARS
jgi:hypothetical protein